jgi:hypothetical protein
MRKFCPLIRGECNPNCALVIEKGMENSCSIFMIAQELDWMGSEMSNLSYLLAKDSESESEAANGKR